MGKLTAKQQRFVEEYLVDLNATQAATRAGYSARTANEQGARLLANVSVRAAIEAAQKALSERTEITQEMVLKRWWDIATADPNELIQLRRTCCRHCHGEGHEYQWIDAEEFRKAVAAAVMVEDAKPDDMPSDAGGYGFDKKRAPHADCPKCFGEGREDIFPLDTRHLKGPARLLYAGVKATRDGLEIKMLDQGKALENVARHLGMFTEKVDLNVKGDDFANVDDVTRAARLAALAAQINRQRDGDEDAVD